MEKRRNLLLSILLGVFSFSAAQNTQLIPELSLSNPIGNFSEDNFGAQQGFGGGLHLDRLNLWKGFGLGLYVGYNQNESDFSTQFPNVINDSGFALKSQLKTKT